ncbi:jg1260, partial [Pararge aegeria aegeria]
PVVRAQRRSPPRPRSSHLPTIAQYLKKISKAYIEKAIRHPNPLVVEASTYTPATDVEPRRRRPKHVLYDHEDQIPTDRQCVQTAHKHTTKTASSPAKTRAPTSDVIRTWRSELSQEAPSGRRLTLSNALDVVEPWGSSHRELSRAPVPR